MVSTISGTPCHALSNISDLNQNCADSKPPDALQSNNALKANTHTSKHNTHQHLTVVVELGFGLGLGFEYTHEHFAVVVELGLGLGLGFEYTRAPHCCRRVRVRVRVRGRIHTNSLLLS
jgi:hypothetical protein